MKYILFFYLFNVITTSLVAQNKPVAPEIGVVQDYENDSILKTQGYQYLVESTQKLFSPKKVSEEKFQEHLEKLKNLKLQLYATNLFIPSDLKVVGPEIDEESVLAYVDVVFQRGKQAGINMIIWGSGGSRQVPEGFDHQKAKEQFVYMAKKVAAIAKKHDIVLALESLNSTEGNFINTVEEALDVVKKVDHKNLRLCADIYHMLKEGESPEIIKQTKNYLVYCEIAEKEGRTPPGINGENFKPYFTALKDIGYEGKVIIECRWDNIESQGADAYQYLREQIKEVYKN
jgi:sugar phosphate isomerase/epimerase